MQLQLGLEMMSKSEKNMRCWVLSATQPCSFILALGCTSHTSSARVVRLVPYSSRVGILLVPELAPPTPAPTASWLSPTIRMTCSNGLSCQNRKPHIRNKHDAVCR